MSILIDLDKLAKEVEGAIKTLVEDKNIDLVNQAVLCDFVGVTVRLSFVNKGECKESKDMKAGYILRGGGVVEIQLSPK